MLSIFARLPWMHRACIALFSALIVIALFLPSPQDLRPDEKLYEVGEHYPIAINAEALISSDSENTAASLRWEKHTIGSGDSMALLLSLIHI